MNYITQHLIEAIKINSERMFPYAKISKGRSLPISLVLIISEISILPSALLLDLIAQFWQKKGLPLMVYEFISMSEIDKFRSSFKHPCIIPKWHTFSFIKMQFMGIYMFLLKGDDRLEQWIKAQLTLMKAYPHFFCMVRHILESLHRIYNLSIKHKAYARKLNINSPAYVCHYMILGHINLIVMASWLDRLAFPLQKKGIPIIYQDLPAIPEDEPSYKV